MAELSAAIRLRPARIALLVSPGDKAAIIRFMRISACMWGGKYNPIIPVFRKPPKAWAAEFPGDVTGLEIARGYIQFFEPDAFIEAQPGLLEKAGLGSLRGHISRSVLTLDKVLAPEANRDWATLHMGLPITDCLEDVYRTEQRFHQRDPSAAMTIATPPASGLAEAMFGVYPDEAASEYFSRTYDDVYRPEALPCSPASWKRMLIGGMTTPLSATSHGIKPQRQWIDDLKIFIFDPTKLTDLIDLWNLRNEPGPLVPVPVGWVPNLLPEIHEIIADEYRQLQGNSRGVMHSAVLEFSRGVSGEAQDKTLELIQPGLPPSSSGHGSLSVKYWRDRIWDKPGAGMMRPPRRIVLDVEEKRVTLEVKESETGAPPSARYEPLRPSFASRYSTSQIRWVNSLRVSNYGSEDLATIYPYNTFDRSAPRIGFSTDVMIGTEGWSFGQKFDGIGALLELETQKAAILGFLQRSGINARLSEPGYIAKQIIDQLGGLWGTHLIADGETLKLMNDMAGGVRRRKNGVEEIEEQFNPRSRTAKEWTNLIKNRRERTYQFLELERFTKSNILVLGLETKCTNCMNRNWNVVDRLGYTLTCTRCLKPYLFPQGAAADERRWTYRVAGPFSVQDYAKGAYGAVLALQTISELDSHFRSINFITAVELELGGIWIEADYIAFHQGDAFDSQYDPILILGEAKSFGQGDLIKQKDISRLQELAMRFPSALLAVSVLRNEFTDTEKSLLRKLVRWGRKLTADGGARNHVLLLTGHELLRQSKPLADTWKEIGGRHAEFSDSLYSRSIRSIAEASIEIHLGLPSFESERQAAWSKRKNNDPNAFLRLPGQWGRVLHSMSGPKA